MLLLIVLLEVEMRMVILLLLLSMPIVLSIIGVVGCDTKDANEATTTPLYCCCSLIDASTQLVVVLMVQEGMKTIHDCQRAKS